MTLRWQRLIRPAALAVPLLAGACADNPSCQMASLPPPLPEAVAPVRPNKAAPAPRGVYKVGDPYRIAGVIYVPQVDYAYDRIGVASWYGHPFHSRLTANGERYDQDELTAAHQTLPLPSVVRVTNLENGRSLVLRVNDRGPFVEGRILDVSRKAAKLLRFHHKGMTRVRIQVLEKESRQAAAELGGTG
jgi:rare lipoprotein A